MPKNIDENKDNLWKNHLDKVAVTALGKHIKEAFPKFELQKFIDAVVDENYTSLELKERINAMAVQLKVYLPDDYSQVIKIISKVAPKVRGFENWTLLTYVEKYGLDNFEQSIAAMELLTRYSTAEFAIRPFMIKYTDQMMPILHRWAEDDNEHVRRLAAEGSRPRGVWVAHIESFKKDPTPVLELLEQLKADESLYVRKAVANNLNDISKEHPKKVIALCKRWQKDKNQHTDWIIKQSCRTMIKKGLPGALALFGFDDNPKVSVTMIHPKKKKHAIGDEIEFGYELLSNSPKKQKLAVDYKIHYQKKNGNRSAKVFKLSVKDLPPKKKISLRAKQSFADMSTRKHFPGAHTIELIVNGQVAHTFEFELK